MPNIGLDNAVVTDLSAINLRVWQALPGKRLKRTGSLGETAERIHTMGIAYTCCHLHEVVSIMERRPPHYIGAARASEALPWAEYGAFVSTSSLPGGGVGVVDTVRG